jgi:hypothetical protein
VVGAATWPWPVQSNRELNQLQNNLSGLFELEGVISSQVIKPLWIFFNILYFIYSLAKAKHLVTYRTKQKFLEGVEQVHHAQTPLRILFSSEVHR